MKQMKNRNIIKKRNTLIKGNYNLSLNEQKLILMTITQIEKEDLIDDNKNYYIDLEKIDNKLSKQNRTRIELFTKDIMKKPILLEEEKGFLVVNWFSHIRYLEDTQQLEISFSKEIKPYLYQLNNNFTRYNLKESGVLGFKSSYSIRFYEFFKSYMNTRHKEFTIGLGLTDTDLNKLNIKNTESKTYQIEFNKGLFGQLQLSKSLRKIPIFKREVLDRVEEDINEKSDIKFTYSLIKKGRKFTHISFKLSHNYEVIEKRKLENGTKYWEDKLKEILNYYSMSIEERIEKNLNYSNNDLDYFWNGYIDNNFLYEKFQIQNDIFYLKNFELKKFNENSETETYVLTLEDLHDQKRGLGKLNSNCKTLYELYLFLKVRHTEETETETNLFSHSTNEGK